MSWMSSWYNHWFGQWKYQALVNDLKRNPTNFLHSCHCIDVLVGLVSDPAISKANPESIEKLCFVVDLFRQHHADEDELLNVSVLYDFVIFLRGIPDLSEDSPLWKLARKLLLLTIKQKEVY